MSLLPLLLLATMPIPKLSLPWLQGGQQASAGSRPKVSSTWTPSSPTESDGNLILLVLDDPPWLSAQQEGLFALDRAGYDFEVDPDNLIPNTPNIDALAAAGVVFDEFRAQPVCSPFRASLLTGVHPFRHGLGSVPRTNYGPQEFGDPGFVYDTVPTVLSKLGVSTGIVGKMHLSIPTNEEFTTAPAQGPNVGLGRNGIGYGVLDRLGFGYHSVWLRNLNQTAEAGSPGTNGDYYWHQRQTEGVLQAVEGSTGSTDALDYATSHQIDEALTFINAQTSRFFLYLPLSATHAPFHDLPPEALVGTAEYKDTNPPTSIWKSYMAMMEAVDSELGRLMAGMDAEQLAKTSFVICGDNGVEQFAYGDAVTNLSKDYGSNWNAISTDTDQMKGSVKCSGVRTTMIWSGPGIATPGRTTDAMVSVVDFQETLREFFGGTSEGPTPGQEGFSFLPCLSDASIGKYTHTRRASFHEIYRPLGTAPTSLPVENFDSINKVERGYVGLVEVTASNDGVDRTKLGQFLLTRKLTEEGASKPPSEPAASGGMNLAFNKDYTPQWPFINAALNARDWVAQDTDETPLNGFDGTHTFVFDANRNPLLPAGKAAGRIFFKDLEGVYPSGTYRARWKGTGTVVFDYQSNNFDVDSVTYHGDGQGADLVVTPAGGGIFVKFNVSDTGDPLRDLELWMPGYNEFSPETFHPDYLASLAPFPALRYMQWSETNNSLQTTWALRITTSSAVQTLGGYGVAWEYQIDLANELNSDLWICVPHQADDDYIFQLATLVAGRYSGPRVRWEYSNEVWNTDFSQYAYAVLHAGDPGTGIPGGDTDYTSAIKWHSQRTAEMWALVEPVISAAGIEFVPVLGSRHRQTFTVRTELDWAAGGSGTALKDLYPNIECAIGLYIGNAIGNSDQTGESPAAIIALLDADILTTFDPDTDNEPEEVYAAKEDCDARGVKLTCYEAGNHMVDTLANDTSAQAMVDAVRDPGMQALVERFVAQWDILRALETDPVGIMHHFEHVIRYQDPFDDAWEPTFGYLEFIGQTDGHKYNALVSETAAAATDQLFHIEDLDGNAIDPFELTPLDILGDYSEQYATLRDDLEALLASDPPTSGSLRIPISGPLGESYSVSLNVDNDLPLNGALGLAGLVDGSGTEITIKNAEGGTATLTLENN